MTRMMSILFASLLVLSVGAYGQAVSGTLLGTVTDASGATIPGAKVTLTEQNTGVSRSTDTTTAGYYAFPDLAPGVYSVSIQQQGFKRGVRTDVQVLVNSTVRIDMQLQTGDVSESIEVRAEAAILQTDRTDTGRKIEVETLAEAHAIPPARIWLMHEGRDSETLRTRGRWLADLCADKGMNFSDRLHIHLWGDTRGT